MELKRIEEYSIGADLKLAIRGLFDSCFPHYPANQIFMGQVPQFRQLLFHENGQLMGHIAVDFRIVNNGGTPVSAFTLSDVCVHPDYRQQGFGTGLMEAVESLAHAFDVEFLLLISADQDWYIHRGFSPVNESMKWLVIRNAQSMGVISRRMHSALMVKAVGSRSWLPGLVDFLGPIF